MTLLVDPRTPNERGGGYGDLLDLLLSVHKVPAVSQTLDFGDAGWVGNGPAELPVMVGAEVKKVPDVLRCIQDGRFAGHQLVGMCNTYAYRWLVIEGSYRKGRFTGVVEIPMGREWVEARPRTMHSALEGWLLTMNLRAGIRPWNTYDRAGTARFLARLYSWWQDPWESHTSHLAMHAPDFIPDVGGEVQTVALTCATVTELWARALPGVGDTRARAAAKEFKTPIGLALATAKMWAEVKGIGKQTAEKVWKVIVGE